MRDVMLTSCMSRLSNRGYPSIAFIVKRLCQNRELGTHASGVLVMLVL